MIARIAPRPLRGQIPAIPSKSEAHRLLVCASLADRPTHLVMGPLSEDIEATIRCLTALGAGIERVPDGLRITPISAPPAACTADCGESGSTLRFLLPIAGALGVRMDFIMHGRLPARPISPLDLELRRGGCTLSRPEKHILRIEGQLASGQYRLPGNVSSQYISGMLFALSLLDGERSIQVEGALESADYVEMTLHALHQFGIEIKQTEVGYSFENKLRFVSPGKFHVGGDWSNGAFWLCADALPGCEIDVIGLDSSSKQGDRRIVEVLNALRRHLGKLYTVDAANIPDLIPALAACACGREQDMRVENARRLRIKESDRLKAIRETLNALGGRAEETDDGLIVRSGHPLRGGEAYAFGDHRIAMMAAIASPACKEEVIIHGAESVNKSYPGFWRDFEALGGSLRLSMEEEI